VNYFAKPAVAIAFGAFFLCAETCLHADSILQFASQPLELPVYDWTAGAFLLVTGILSGRKWTLTRRQYQAVAWGFMLSLLVGAFIPSVTDWLSPPDETHWLSEGGFVLAIAIMIAVAGCGIVSTLTAREQ
jgi:uncharacterized protein involved in response to NO